MAWADHRITMIPIGGVNRCLGEFIQLQKSLKDGSQSLVLLDMWPHPDKFARNFSPGELSLTAVS
jgi:hypothetical protein